MHKNYILIKNLIFFLIFCLAFNSLRAVNYTPPITLPLYQEKPTAALKNQQLLLSGLSGPGLLEIYSIIGNKIKEIKIQELGNLKLYLELETKKMYILRISSSTGIHTLKIISS